MTRDDELMKLMEQTADKENPNDQDQRKPVKAVSDVQDVDQTQPVNVDDVDIPDEELTEYLTSSLKNEMLDKEELGLADKIAYDKEAYYEIHNEFAKHYPYEGASSWPESLTSSLLDTAHPMIDDLIWRGLARGKVVTVTPTEDGDYKKAANVEHLLNWQNINYMPNHELQDSEGNFFTLLHGNQYEMLLRVDEKNRIKPINVPLEFIYLPIDSQTPDPDDCEGITRIIPMSGNHIRRRLAEGRYRNLNALTKDFFPRSLLAEEMRRMREEVEKLGETTAHSRDTYYMAERYFTYYPKGSLRRRELIVTFSPANGQILRKIENKDGIRPFIKKMFYPNYGKAFDRSLPEMLRNIQEKADWKSKQSTDNTDKANSPSMYYDALENKFDPRLNMRQPNAAYPMKNLNSMKFEEINIAPIMLLDRQIANLYLQAERRSGITDMMQGVASASTPDTLGQDQMRSQRADVRFTKIIKHVNNNWKQKQNKIYQYDEKYMPRSVKVRVLGSRKFETLESLFPIDKEEGATKTPMGLGSVGMFDFGIANKSIDEQERINQKRLVFYEKVLATPLGQDKGSIYRILETQGEASGVYDLENIVNKPPEADQMTPDEVIQHLLDGGEIMPDGSIVNYGMYVSAIEVFMRTGNFKAAPQKVKIAFMRYHMIIKAMRESAVLGFQDFNQVEGVKSGLQAMESMAPPMQGTPSLPENGGTNGQ